jgi:hypothetical protein
VHLKISFPVPQGTARADWRAHSPLQARTINHESPAQSKENIMSKLFNTTATNCIAASLAPGLLAPSGFAGNIGTSNPFSTVGRQSLAVYGTYAAPKIMVKICTEFGPAHLASCLAHACVMNRSVREWPVRASK